MLDIKRALKASPKKRRSPEPLKQLWTPWGERIRDEWLCENAGNKAFRPIEEESASWRSAERRFLASIRARR